MSRAAAHCHGSSLYIINAAEFDVRWRVKVQQLYFLMDSVLVVVDSL